MSRLPDPSPAEMARIAGHHADSLRAAGIEWISAASPPPAEPEPGARTAHRGSGSSPSLFADVAQPMATARQPAEAQVAAPVPSVEERRQALKVLAEKVSTCTRCAELASTRTQTVFGVGKIDPELCFIGEAPGADEDATGEPFVGAAGQLLNRIIAACGMKREEVYICNIIKCRPPGNRLPQPNEVANCREYLEMQLELVRPKFICALGACAAQNLLDTKATIGRLRGQFHSYRGIPVLCTYHPAYLLRSPDKKKDVWEDLKKLLSRMGRPIK
jgi:uracil-DNA glycosylase family 4